MNHLTVRDRLYAQPQPSGLASMTWEHHYQNLVRSLPGTPEEKDAIIRKRILKYFGGFQLQNENYFCPRIEPYYNHPSCSIIPDQLILYGTDYLSLNRVQQEYFKGYLTQVARLDDSHMIITFVNPAQCLSALNQMSSPNGRHTEISQVIANSFEGWTPMKCYMEFMFLRRLMARFATSIDRQIYADQSKAQKSNLYFAYSEAKRKFMEDLQQSNSFQPRTQQKNRNNSRSREKNQRNNSPCCHCSRRDRRRNDGSWDRHRNGRGRHSRSREEKHRGGSNNKLPSHNRNRFEETEERFEKFVQRRDSSAKRAEDLERSTGLEDMFVKPANNGSHNTTLQEFEQVLERLRLDDSRNCYSTFEIDQDD